MSMKHAAGEAGLAPIAAAERIHALDIIRGFALIGIFLMNVEWFTRPLAEFGTGVDVQQHGPSYFASWFIYTFVQGKFWTMFSLLFGMGFAVMLGRAQQGAREFTVPYLRRIAALMAFGIGHYVLVWTGDILHNYAIVALFLLLIVTRSWLGWLATLMSVVAIGNGYGVQWLAASLGFLALAAGTAWVLRRAEVDRWYKLLGVVLLSVAAAVSLGPTAPEMAATAGLLGVVAILMYVLNGGSLARWWKWALGMYMLPFVLFLGYLGAVGVGLAPLPGHGPDAAKQRSEASAKTAKERAEEVRVFSTGSYAESVAWRAESFREEIAGSAGIAILALPMFMFGFWFVRSGVIGAWRQHLPLFRRLAVLGLSTGLALTLGSVFVQASFPRHVVPTLQTGLAQVLFQIGWLPLCIGYVSTIFCLLGTGLGATLFSPLRHAGRMALTNYLGASVLGTLYFSGYGLGHYLQVSRAGQVLFVAVVFTAQVAFSALWLSRFRYGPMEWLWRAVTYWTLPPMRRGREPALTPIAQPTGA
jgi:uncharacterized protein